MPDTTPPRGSLLLPPAFGSAITNPYGLGDVGSFSSPSFVDIDADGDVLIGEKFGNTKVRLNTGTASVPAFGAATTNPYGLVDVGSNASPSFVDIDADGDMDALIGNSAGNTLVQLNTGTASVPAFGAATTNPYGLVDVGTMASPSLVDIDGDGDLDILLGIGAGNTLVQLNTGTASAPAFGSATTNPYGLVDVVNYASPSLVDIDGDGDLDALIGNNHGNTLVQLNTGTASAPAFASATTNPYGLGDVGSIASPSFADIDGDGDLDALIGNSDGNTLVRLNIGGIQVAPVTSTTANGTYGVGATITLTVGFDEAVLVTGTPTLLLETGTTDRTATYASGSGTSTLSFTYTVQAGDASADLDQASSSALSLNGGTIKDAAGNNAILTLAAPGATGSLGANKAIVIDTPAVPSVTLLVSKSSIAEAGGTSTVTATLSAAASTDTTVTLGATGTATGSGTDYTLASSTITIKAGQTTGTTTVTAVEDGVLESNETVILDITAVTGGDGATESGTQQQTITLLQDTTSPGGSLLLPSFGSATTNPYGLKAVNAYASPNLIDIDGDGDLDALIGSQDGDTLVQLNTGTASAPTFGSATPNPYGLGNVVRYASPSFVDIDGDGDIDALIGNVSGNTLVQLNTGTVSAPAFGSATPNPYGLGNVVRYASPSFVDIDGDGDIDALIGNVSGNTLVQLNTGTASAPAFGSAATNPYGLGDVGDYASPSFVDIGADGDLDALIGNKNGNTLVQLNTGTASAPAFGSATTNPYGLVDVGGYANPALVDIDADGDMDALIGNSDGNTLVQLNTGGRVAPVTTTTANGTYGAGTVITLTVGFNEPVIVTGTPTLLLETGAIDRTASYTSGSGTSTLSFTYTAQVGDNSADLDQASSSALSLNGGTIKDAAGNNAVLTLAAPGTTGSLGANKAIVITPPLVTLFVNKSSIAEAGGISTVTATLNVTASTDATITLGSTGTATGSGTDYTLASGTITVLAGQTTGTTTVTAVEDGVVESNETVILDITAVTGGDGATESGTQQQTITLLQDTTPPRGSLLLLAFGSATTNPYGLTGVSHRANPSFVDIDADGDLDALIGDYYGCTLVQPNIGTASGPLFGSAATNPYGLVDVGQNNSPSFVDIDADGDLDALIGNFDGNTLVQLNIGTASGPLFGSAATNPYGLGDVGYYANPNLVDIDADGDMDALIGSGNGNMLVQLNTGTASAPAFASATTNPYGLVNVVQHNSPYFVDIDGDGDLDALIGDQASNTQVQLNTGTASSAAFGSATTNPYGLGNAGLSSANPSFVDIDGDGDMDALIGNFEGNTQVQLNTSARVAPVTSSTADGTYGPGTVITLTVEFNETVIVTGAPTLLLETGTIDRAASYVSGSGTSTLSFTYTVQVGDNSADLDQASSSALSLNGGTIRDAAGNNAVLTLAAPGTTGSLGANKAIVIDTTAPSAPSAPDMTAGTDSGSSSSDDKTSNTTPTFTGTAESNATVKLYDTDGSTVLGTTTADGSGNWSITSSALGEGSHTLTVKATDAASNVSKASSGLGVTIDTTNPTAATPSVTNYKTSAGGNTHSFTITYSDTGTGLDTSTFGTGNVTVKDGSSTSLPIASAVPGGNTVTYTFTAPGGSWDSADAGTYTIGMVGASVKDMAGNAVAANASATTFTVSNNIAPVITSNGGGTTASVNVTENATAVTTVTGTDADNDTLTFSITGGSDSGKFSINAGTGALVLTAAPDFQRGHWCSGPDRSPGF